MRKFINISVFVLTLLGVSFLCGYIVYEHFHSKLEDVNLVLLRSHDRGFINYDHTRNMIFEICDTVNNKEIRLINLDSLKNSLYANPWIVNIDANITLKRILNVEIVECKPIMRIYNKNGNSVYLDAEGNIYPENTIYTPHVLIGSGNLKFPILKKTSLNINSKIYANTDLPEMFILMKKIYDDSYSACCVRQVYRDINNNYELSMSNTNLCVFFGDDKNVEDKLFRMQHFFKQMQGNPELKNYEKINLNYNKQVVCTKNKEI